VGVVDMFEIPGKEEIDSGCGCDGNMERIVLAGLGNGASSDQCLRKKQSNLGYPQQRDVHNSAESALSRFLISFRNFLYHQGGYEKEETRLFVSICL
jgi:hypothetical protein